jgi:phospholipid transport system substrate-binding protein
MNKLWAWTLKSCVLTAIAATALAVHAQSVGPDVLVKKTSEEVLNIIRSDKEIRAGNTARITQLIEEKVAPHFDFNRMTRLAVGRSWREATDEQKAALTGEFRALLVRSYAAAFTAYTGSRWSTGLSG